MSIRFDGSATVSVPGAGAIIGSEFAEVAVSIDEQANSPRLRVEDLRLGHDVHYDPGHGLLLLAKRSATTLPAA